MTIGLPSPHVPLVEDDGGPTVPWYNYLKSADVTWRTKITHVTTGTTTNTLISNNGVTLIQTTPATTNTLANPEPGISKILVVTSATTTGQVVASTTLTEFLPGTGWRLVFGSSSANKRIELIGLSTFQWLIVSNPDSVTITT